MDDSPQEGCTSSRKTLDCDREAWLVDQIYVAVKMAIGVVQVAEVGAHQLALDYAIRGIVHGAAVEISRGVFGFDPEFINLQKHPRENIQRVKQRMTHIHLGGDKDV